MQVLRLRLRSALTERLQNDRYRKAMKIGRVLVAAFALILGISVISGLGEDTQAAARRSRSNDQSFDGSILPFDFQFVGQGRVTGGLDDLWVIGNVPIRVDGHTQVGRDLHPGDFVTLSGRILANKVWLADRLELAERSESIFTFNGPLEETGSDSWLVGGYPLIVDAQTVLGENLLAEEIVLVTFTVLDNGDWLALEIKAFDRFPVDPTPVPTPTQIQALAPTQAVISNTQPSWDSKPKDRPKGNKDGHSKGKGDSRSKGKAKGHSK